MYESEYGLELGVSSEKYDFVKPLPYWTRCEFHVVRERSTGRRLMCKIRREEADDEIESIEYIRDEVQCVNRLVEWIRERDGTTCLYLTTTCHDALPIECMVDDDEEGEGDEDDEDDEEDTAAAAGSSTRLIRERLDAVLSPMGRTTCLSYDVVVDTVDCSVLLCGLKCGLKRSGSSEVAIARPEVSAD